MRKPAQAARKIGGPWKLSGVGTCRLRVPSAKGLEQIDELWSALRDREAPNAHWKWTALAIDAREIFAVVETGAKEVLSLWCSKNPSAELEGKVFYRLDYFEVAPNRRDFGIGALTMVLVARRAAELECTGILLAATPDAITFYQALDGVSRNVTGWQCPAGLTPIVFEGESFKKLQERIHEFE